VSSVAALGRKANGAIVTEDKKWEDDKVNTNYAISKYQAEMEVWRAIGEGLHAVISQYNIGLWRLEQFQLCDFQNSVR
jgi:hypothetical protein